MTDKKNEDAVVQSPDVQAADKAGVSEGDIKALRDESGLNQSAGHEANVAAWEASDEGKAFLATEKDRNKEAKAGAKEAADSAKEQSESEKAYTEAVGKG